MCNSIPKGFTAVWDSFGIFLPSSCLGDNQWQVVLKDFGGGDMDDPLQVHTRPMEELPRTVCKAGFSSLGLQAAVISNRSSVYTVLPLVYLSPALSHMLYTLLIPGTGHMTPCPLSLCMSD